MFYLVQVPGISTQYSGLQRVCVASRYSVLGTRPVVHAYYSTTQRIADLAWSVRHRFTRWRETRLPVVRRHQASTSVRPLGSSYIRSTVPVPLALRTTDLPEHSGLVCTNPETMSDHFCNPQGVSHGRFPHAYNGKLLELGTPRYCL